MSKSMSEQSLDSESFNTIAALAYKESGLQLVAEKISMIQSRLRHRVRALGFPDFKVYTKFVCSNEGVEERRHMISALTTNVSHFFREQHHFDILRDTILPSYLDGLKTGGRLRIWSAGSSNGQEACSIAMTLLEAAPEVANYDVRILATDIDPKVINFAKQGQYDERLMNGVSEPLLAKYFTKSQDASETCYVVKKSLRDLIRFNELNLLANWPMRQSMDVVFCRNVVIYFDQETQEALWPRFQKILTPAGYLFLGHSERISDPERAGFVTSGPTTYRPTSSLHSIQS